MPGTEDTAAIGSVIVRASSLLDALNDAIERALKTENKSFLSGSSRRSPNTPLDPGSLTVSSDSPGDYAYMLGGDSYAMPSRMSSRMSSRRTSFEEPVRAYANPPSKPSGGGGVNKGDMKGEARILGEIRESLAQVEEHLYKVQELQENQQDDRVAAIRDVDCRREQLLQLLQQHKGQEWEVVQEVARFCGGDPPQDPLRGGQVPSPQVYKRSLVSPYSTTRGTPYQLAAEAGSGVLRGEQEAGEESEEDRDGQARTMGGSGYGRSKWRASQRGVAEDWEVEEEEEGTDYAFEDEDERHGGSIQFAAHGEMADSGKSEGGGDGEIDDGEDRSSEEELGSDVTNEDTQQRQGEESRGGLGGLVIGLPGKALSVLGDAAGHVASFTVKVAVVSLGIAAVLSLGEELTQMRNQRQQPALRKNLKPAVRPTIAAGVQKRVPPRVPAPAGAAQKPTQTPPVKPRAVNDAVHKTPRPHAHGHGGHNLPALSPDQVTQQIFQGGAFPQCTIRERMEKQSLGDFGSSKKEVFLGRG